MREFVFALDYEPGYNPVADTLARHSDCEIRSLSCHVTPESLWRVDHATGSEAALSDLEAAFRETTYCADCLVTENCGADCDVQVLDRSADTLVVYTYWQRAEICTSVPHLALSHLGEGLLFETKREKRRYRWRIVLSNDADIPTFFDALASEVGDVAGMEMLRLTDLTPNHQRSADPTLPREQQEALCAAVENGYYETPRRTDLTELAASLELPRSTLSYRLRRAEAALAREFVGSEPALDSLTTSY